MLAAAVRRFRQAYQIHYELIRLTVLDQRRDDVFAGKSVDDGAGPLTAASTLRRSGVSMRDEIFPMNAGSRR